MHILLKLLLYLYIITCITPGIIIPGVIKKKKKKKEEKRGGGRYY